MTACEENGIKAAYFISDRTAGLIDGTYDIFDPRIGDLMREMVRRGHDIGMHGSYHTYQSKYSLRKEPSCRKPLMPLVSKMM